MPKSETYANDVLDLLYGSGTPATLYFGLFTSAPGPTGTGGTEVTGGSYARKAVTNNNTNFPAAAARVKSNATAITFVTATANWGTVESVGVFDALSGGDPLEFGDLDTPRTINNGDQFSFAIDQFVVTET